MDWIGQNQIIRPYAEKQKHIDISLRYQKSCDGLHLLIDSTGLKFLGEGEWKCQEY